MKHTTIIIQARTGSTRMPQKVILPFYDEKGIFEILLQKLKTTGLPIVLATTNNKIDDVLAEIAKQSEVSVFRGSEENVLERFIGAAEKNDAKNIVRVCADNPFLDVKSILQLAEEFEKTPSEYLSFGFSETRPSIKTHFGFYTEITTLEALQKTQNLTSEKLYIEHVTNFIYGHPEIFNVRFINAPEIIFNRKDIRLTLDTPEDFQLQQKIYSDLKQQNPNFGIEEIVAYLDEKPELLQQMQQEIERHQK